MQAPALAGALLCAVTFACCVLEILCLFAGTAVVGGALMTADGGGAGRRERDARAAAVSGQALHCGLESR